MTLWGLVIVISSSACAYGQDSKLMSPQPEHALLKRFAGEWQFVKRSVPADGRSDIVGRGEISAKMIGHFFVVCKWNGKVYGTDFEAVQSFGYSVKKKKYTGTWIDSLMSYQWQLDGTVTEAKPKFVVVSNGPGAKDKTTEFRETYHFRPADNIHIIAEMKQDDKWQQFMTTDLSRKKVASKAAAREKVTPDSKP